MEKDKNDGRYEEFVDIYVVGSGYLSLAQVESTHSSSRKERYYVTE